MTENWGQHTGGDQLIHGLPKHMEAVAGDDKNAYWEIVPGKSACATCKAMRGMRFDRKPGPVHPNCNCEMRQVVQQADRIQKRVVASDTLQGHGENTTERFEAGQKIIVEIRNLGPFLAGVWIRVDGQEERTTDLMHPGKIWRFEFSKFREPPVPWVVFLMCIGGDSSTIMYSIRG